MEKAKYGKLRQVTALNGSKMVVKIGVVYYRRKQEYKVTSRELISLLYTIASDISTIKYDAPQFAERRSVMFGLLSWPY